MTYSAEVFKTFVSDFEAFVSSCDTIENTQDLKGKILNARFLLDMLFLADINIFLSTFSKLVQKSSNLPWEYSNDFDFMMCNLEIMIEQISSLRDKSLQSEGDDMDLLFSDLSHKLFPYFKTSLKILTDNSYQDIHSSPS